MTSNNSNLSFHEREREADVFDSLYAYYEI